MELANAGGVPIIGEPKILGTTIVVLIMCTCDSKALMMGPVGPSPFECAACGTKWVVDGEMRMGVGKMRGAGSAIV